MSKKKALSYISAAVMCVMFVGCTSDMSGNGRNFRVPLPEGLMIQAPPPKDKLISFMNEKYGIKFKQYKGTEFSEIGRTGSHISAYDFDKNYNGIVVSTEKYPDHYFFVCDYYGVVHDDFGCHLAEFEAEQIIESQLSEVINDNYKVIIHPDFFQGYIFSTKPIGVDYLENGDYIIRIYISGNGDNAEADFDAISKAVAPYWDEDRRMYIYYIDDSDYNTISADEYSSYSDFTDYNKKGTGWGWTEEETIHLWEWEK